MAINPEYFSVIKEFSKKGVRFIVASGRHTVSVNKLFAPVLDDISIISQNGNIIVDNGVPEVLHPIPMEWAQEFWEDIAKFKDEGLEGKLDFAGGTYCPESGTPMHNILVNEYKYNTVAVGYGALPEEAYSMMTIFHPTPGVVEKYKSDYFDAKWQDRIDLLPSGKWWVDCVMKDCSKGSALIDYCRRAGIDLKDTIAFGDNINDISMITAAGVGYAVSNSRPEVQSAADRVIPGFEENGVLQELKKILAEM